MNAKEFKKFLVKNYGQDKFPAHTEGIFRGIPYQIDRTEKDSNQYVITMFERKKPQFKIGNKIFIVS